jgi:tetratricopeptide (TPR) repeat protein
MGGLAAVVAYGGWCGACAQKREFEEAIELFTKAIDLDESNVDLKATIVEHRANALLRLKRFEEAIEDCDLVIEFGKPSTNAYITRSMANTVRPDAPRGFRYNAHGGGPKACGHTWMMQTGLLGAR